MSPFIAKTLGGLTPGAYIRHLVLIGIVMAVPMFIVLSSNPPFYFYPYVIVLTLLYPYARFAYESVVGYIMGNNIVWLPLPFMLIAKIFTMVICWAFSVIIAPIGLVCLYYDNTKYEKETVQGMEMEKAVYVEKKKAWEAEKAKIPSGVQE